MLGSIGHLLATHYHPDHAGLVQELNWFEAEARFCETITMGDVLPQP